MNGYKYSNKTKNSGKKPEICLAYPVSDKSSEDPGGAPDTSSQEGTHQEDFFLVRKFKAEEKAKKRIFLKLITKYQERLFRLAAIILGNSADAEDALQEALISAYRSLHKFQERSSFYTWLYRITLNKAKDIKNKKRKNITNSIEENELKVADTRLIIQEELETSELSDFILNKIRKLKDIYRDILILRYFEEFSYQDIVGVLKIREGTVKSRLFKAKAGLKKLILADKRGEAYIDFM